MTDMSNETNASNVKGHEFTLFLIFILLIMGNQNRLGSYFNSLESEVNKLNGILKAVTATSEGLKGAMAASQTIQDLTS